MQYIAPKLLYTFLFACQGSAPVYLPLFYSSHLGLKSNQIGVLVAIAPFISAIACPLWTAIADKTRTHGYIMCIIQTLATLTIVSVMAIPVLVASVTGDNSIEGQGTLKMSLVTVTSICFAFFGVPVGPLVDGGVLKILGRSNKNQYGRQRMFGSLSFGLASSFVGFIADWTEDLNSIFYVYAVAAICFIITAGNTYFKVEIHDHRLSDEPRPISLRARTTATALSSVRRGSQDHSQHQMENFEIDQNEEEEWEDEDEPMEMRRNEIQRLVQFATESSIIEAVNLSNPPPHRQGSGSGSFALGNHGLANEPANLLAFISQPPVLLFFTTMMLMGAALNMVVSFLFIFLKKDLGASSSTVGLTGLVGSVTELLFFFYSRDLIRIFGIKCLVIFGHILTIIRVTGYTMLPRNATGVNIALGLHLLNGKSRFMPCSLTLAFPGIAFSALWGAGVVQADELAPPSLQATSQGILAAMYAGVGAGLGSFMGGVIYEKYGATSMFHAVIAITTFSMELYLEANTQWGLRHILKRLYRSVLGMRRWIRHARGRQPNVPRWSGQRREGPIRLDSDE